MRIFHTPSEINHAIAKMAAFDNGTRKENLKACRDDKLLDYYDICKQEGYYIAKRAIETELINRGLLKNSSFLDFAQTLSTITDTDILDLLRSANINTVIKTVASGSTIAECEHTLRSIASIRNRVKWVIIYFIFTIGLKASNINTWIMQTFFNTEDLKHELKRIVTCLMNNEVLMHEIDEAINNFNNMLESYILQESPTKYKYSYSGPTYRFNKFYAYWTGETQAISSQKALSNLTFKAKKDFNWTPTANLSLDIDYLSQEEAAQTHSTITSTKTVPQYCDTCGTRLTDGGFCPKCDDGSEDYLEENIEKHDTLNPKLWDEDKTLKEEVIKKIHDIVDEFTKGLDEKEIKYKLDDIKIVGSNCSYNYTKNSDLDVHLVFDLNIYDDTEKQEMAELIYDYARGAWNKNHTITFYGIPVEIYIETNNTEDLNKDKNSNLSL